jgi:iron complex outermembrane receptor protein
MFEYGPAGLLRRSSLIALAAAGVAAIAAPISAQEGGASGGTNARSGNTPIVVTARRREESLQETPIAVSAFNAETLAARQIQQTSDLEKFTPSLQFKPAGQLSGNSASTVVFIRGVGQLDPTAAVDPGVGIYIDEVYVGRAVGGAIEFGDIGSVEVLRGPQGTLFGRNTIGGAILVRTKEPELGEFSGTARLRAGDDSLFQGFAALNLPLGETMAARVSGGFRSRDGYVVRAFDGLELGNDNTYTINGAFLWEVSPDVRLNIRADYTNRDENGAPFVFAGINEKAPVAAIVSVAAGCPGATMPFVITAPDPRFGAPNVPMIDDPRCANDFQDRGPFVNGGTAPVVSTSEVWGVSGTLEADLTDSLTLKSITAYRSTQSYGVRDADNTPFTMITTDLGAKSDQFSQELQVQFESDRVHAILGGYYFNESTEELVTVPLAFPPSPPVINSLLAGGPGSRDLQLSELDTESIAVFGEVSFEVTDGLELTGGLRYTNDDKTFVGTVLNLFPATLPNPNPLPTLAIPEGGPLFIFHRPFEDSFSALTGSASIRYSWSDFVSTYASYARSFKSGGFNTRYNAPPPGNVPVGFGEETVDSYEVGAKFEFGDARLNLAAFRADYSDIQLIFRQGVVPLLFNAGKARMKGLEAEFSYHSPDGLMFDASASILDDDIRSITPIPGATATVAPGDDLPLTPSFQGSFGIGYEIMLNDSWSLTPRFDGSYSSSVVFITGSVPEIEEDGYFVGNATVMLKDEDKGWRVTAGVNNLFNELYLIQGNASLGTLGYAEKMYARPRSWFVEVGVEF